MAKKDNKEFKANFKEVMDPNFIDIEIKGVQDNSVSMLINELGISEQFLSKINVDLGLVAADIPFDPTGTGLSSTNVQDAIAEVKSDIPSP